jgi:hypothetical protein
MCLFLVCEPVKHVVEARLFKGFRGSTNSSSPIVQGDGLLVETLASCRICARRNSSEQWIVVFLADLVRSEVMFTTVVCFAGNWIQTLTLCDCLGLGMVWHTVSHCAAVVELRLEAAFLVNQSKRALRRGNSGQNC